MISTSPRGEGFSPAAYVDARSSKKYSPVTAWFDLGLAGFSSRLSTRPLPSNSTTPKAVGSLTG